VIATKIAAVSIGPMFASSVTNAETRLDSVVISGMAASRCDGRRRTEKKWLEGLEARFFPS
jgi:hypothetical protein